MLWGRAVVLSIGFHSRDFATWTWEGLLCVVSITNAKAGVVPAIWAIILHVLNRVKQLWTVCANGHVQWCHMTSPWHHHDITMTSPWHHAPLKILPLQVLPQQHQCSVYPALQWAPLLCQQPTAAREERWFGRLLLTCTCTLLAWFQPRGNLMVACSTCALYYKSLVMYLFN